MARAAGYASCSSSHDAGLSGCIPSQARGLILAPELQAAAAEIEHAGSPFGRPDHKPEGG